jgi:hypothetical protein
MEHLSWEALMTRLGSWRLASWLALLMLAAGAGATQDFDVVTLVSPNRRNAFGEFGRAVSAAGDVDQDGIVDVIVGAHMDASFRGRAYVFSGRDESLLLRLRAPELPLEIGAGFGWSVAGVGDLDQDGFADVVVGKPGGSHEAGGRAYVFRGQDGGLLIELISPNEEEGGSFGWSVSGAGDVDADGVPDVIVGAPNEDPGGSPEDAGRAYLFSGRDGSHLATLKSPNEFTGGLFGWSVSDAGDAQQDGFPDVIVGAWREESPSFGGRAYVFNGRDGSLHASLESPNAVQNGSFGWSVSGAGDVDGDGAADVVVGAPDEDNHGRAYVFSGRDGSPKLTLVSPNTALFGSSVSDAGDADRDGAGDVIVGASYGPDASGRAHLYSGSDGSLLSEFVSPNPEFFGGFGTSVASADVNADGLPDMIVGAPREDLGGDSQDAGRAYVFLAATGQPQTLAVVEQPAAPSRSRPGR